MDRLAMRLAGQDWQVEGEDTNVRAQYASRIHFHAAVGLIAAAALFLFGASPRAQTGPATPSAREQGGLMKQFVIIFRQGPKPLSDVDLKNRAEETRAWAREQNAAGHKLVPHILAPEGQRIGSDGESGPVPADTAGSITALLFLEARDLAEAADIARAHPALRYGSSVEVRPWDAPPGPSPTRGP
jgi:hypothetical protein